MTIQQIIDHLVLAEGELLAVQLRLEEMARLNEYAEHTVPSAKRAREHIHDALDAADTFKAIRRGR